MRIGYKNTPESLKLARANQEGAPIAMLVASGPLSALRAVRLDVSDELAYASNDNTAAINVLGITKTSASAQGDPVEVVTTGSFSDSSWAWTPGAIYLGVNGVLTQTVPTSGTVLKIATSLRPDTILVQVGMPVTLA